MTTRNAQRQASGPFLRLPWRAPHSQAKAAPAVTDVYGDRPYRIPRLWRPGLGSTSSVAGGTWPPDASTGTGMARTRHLRVIRPRNPDNASVVSGSSPRPSTNGRLISVRVPSANTRRA